MKSVNGAGLLKLADGVGEIFRSEHLAVHLEAEHFRRRGAADELLVEGDTREVGSQRDLDVTLRDFEIEPRDGHRRVALERTGDSFGKSNGFTRLDRHDRGEDNGKKQ